MSSYFTTGTSGTLGQEWQIQNQRRNQLSRYYGMSSNSDNENMDFHSYLAMSGVDENVVLAKIEFNITGTDKQADGSLLSWDRDAWSATSTDDKLFQSQGHGYYTNVNFDKGTYEILDEQTFSESLGMDWSGGKPYDVLEVVSNTINFHDFVFAGTSDGVQDSISLNLDELTTAKWGINKFNITEVDPSMRYSSGSEGLKASMSMNLMLSEADRWLTDGMKEQLSQYPKGSSAYNQLLSSFAYHVFDNEQYLSGNEITSPADKETNIKIAEGNKYGVVRGLDGQLLVGLNGEDLTVGGLGTVSGQATLSLGKTSGKSNESVVQIGQKAADGNLKIDVNGKIVNQEIYGQNIDAQYRNRFATAYNVSWNASNSNLDSSKGSASLMIETTENAKNNNFNLGTAARKTDFAVGGQYMEFDNLFVDNGQNNTVKSSSSSSNYFTTTETSKNATLYGGDKGNRFDIGGKHAIAIGGKGDDVFTTSSDAVDNYFAGREGNDTLYDNGKNTIFDGGQGVDSAFLNGTNAMVQMGMDEDYRVQITGGAVNNQVWAGNKYTREATEYTNDSQQMYYKYKDELNKYMNNVGISYDELMKRLGTAEGREIIRSLKTGRA